MLGAYWNKSASNFGSHNKTQKHENKDEDILKKGQQNS